MNDLRTSITRWWRIDAAGVAVCLAVTALSYLSLVQPMSKIQMEADRLTPLLSQRVGDVRIARASLAELQKGLDDTREALDDQPLRLESGTQVNSRMAILADLALQAGLELHQMLPDQTRVGERYNIVPIVLSGSGDYRKVTRFMRDVHEKFADLAVVEFDLSSSGSSAQGQARFDLGLAWFTMPVLGYVDN
jgi:Tfp pilus assembly protein PilO